MRDGVEELLHYCDYIVASEVFARQISNGGVEGALRKLSSYGPKGSVITLGARGCVLEIDDEAVLIPAFSVDAVDTTGAGDVFHGAFSYGVVAGWDIKRICIFANAVAALKCTRVGGRAGIPGYDEVIRFIKKNHPEVEFPPASCD